MKRHKVSSRRLALSLFSKRQGESGSYVKVYMLTSVKSTKSGTPIPLDSAGNEICLLFLKYGRCRFRKKCKKSHWTPPLPDEESPPPPPRPPSPPSSFPDRCSSFEQEVANPHISVLDEQPEQHTALVNEANTEKENIILNTTCAETSITFPNLDSLLDQDEFKCRSQDQSFVTMPSTNFCPNNFQEDTEPMFTSASTSNNSLTQSCLGTDIRDLAENTEKEIRDLKTASDNNESSTKHKLEKVLDRTMEVINKGNCRFDYLYHHVGQTKDCSWRFRSSLDQSYQSYGAYYDNMSQKLQFHHQPQNKVEKKRLKLLRRSHWNTLQTLNTRLAQVPPGYNLKVNFARVNFSRLRPYFYLLVQQCLFCEDTTEKRWRPHTFSCLVTETLMALFTSCNITPEEAERKMQEWGARPVRARQCISHMWNIIVKSSLSNGVAQEVVDCEQQVFRKKLSVVDYAYACFLARPLVKANREKPSLPITKSVRKGIKAATERSLVEKRRKTFKSPKLSENIQVQRKAMAFGRTSEKSHNDDAKRKVATCKKKRKTRRSRQISLLDEAGKQDLKERCKNIIDE